MADHHTDHTKNRCTLVFMGTPNFAVPSLQNLARHHDIKAVYSQPPSDAGRRGMKLTPSPIHQEAEKLGLAIETPSHFDAAAIAKLASMKVDFFIVVAYGITLPQAVLDLPRLAAINGHASLLPRWRGAAPIERAIIAGDSITGVSAMIMEEALDSGGVLLKQEEPVHANDTGRTLSQRLSGRMAEMLVETLDRFEQLSPQPQEEAEVTWAKKITPEEAEINFTQSSAEIISRIRAFSPRPGAWFLIDAKKSTEPVRLKVLEAVLRPRPKGKEQAIAGTNLGTGYESAPLLASEDGAIELLKLQPQGKTAMHGADFLKGNSLPALIKHKMSKNQEQG